MVSWTCPYCGKLMHSAWDRRDEKVLVCLYCEGTFENPYYGKEWRVADDSKSNSKLCRQEPRF